MNVVRICAILLLSVPPAGALKIGISAQDVERALTIARAREAERDRFHAAYIKRGDTAFIDSVEVISELRRVVLVAEEQAARGDRQFAYSLTRATEALALWRRRVAVVARVRFHPQNNYVNAPPVTMRLAGNEAALIGIKRGFLPPGRVGGFAPVMGAVVEGVFDAQALGQSAHEFVIELEGRTLGRATFDFSLIE